jgi:hypothetical protein
MMIFAPVLRSTLGASQCAAQSVIDLKVDAETPDFRFRATLGAPVDGTEIGFSSNRFLERRPAMLTVVYFEDR